MHHTQVHTHVRVHIHTHTIHMQISLEPGVQNSVCAVPPAPVSAITVTARPPRPRKDPLDMIFKIFLLLSHSHSLDSFLSLGLHKIYFWTGHHWHLTPEKERGFALLPFGTSQVGPFAKRPSPVRSSARSPAQPPRQGGDCLIVFQLVETNRSLLLASRTMSRPT